MTDMYELTMVQAALADGTADTDSVFELFARRLPAGRRYGVVAGTGRMLEALAAFRFGDDELAVVADLVDTRTADWLVDSGQLSGRGYDRILRLAWSISDLAGRERPDQGDVAEATQLRIGHSLPN